MAWNAAEGGVRRVPTLPRAVPRARAGAAWGAGENETCGQNETGRDDRLQTCPSEGFKGTRMCPIPAHAASSRGHLRLFLTRRVAIARPSE